MTSTTLYSLPFFEKVELTTGDIEKSLRSDEEFKYKPSSPYSASKASADHFVNSYIRTYGINAVISNCCNNYGPYQYHEKLIPKMISKNLPFMLSD